MHSAMLFDKPKNSYDEKFIKMRQLNHYEKILNSKSTMQEYFNKN